MASPHAKSTPQPYGKCFSVNLKDCYDELTKLYRSIDFEQDFFCHNQTIIDHKVDGDLLANSNGFTNDPKLYIVLLHDYLTWPLRQV